MIIVKIKSALTVLRWTDEFLKKIKPRKPTFANISAMNIGEKNRDSRWENAQDDIYTDVYVKWIRNNGIVCLVMQLFIEFLAFPKNQMEAFSMSHLFLHK